MSQPTLTAMTILKGLSVNVAAYNLTGAVELPPRTASPDDLKGFKDIAKILEAIVHFLPHKGGQVYALTLETSGSTTQILVAGNDETHFTPHRGKSLGQFISRIWEGMQNVSRDPGPRSQSAKSLVKDALVRAQVHMVKRFNKRKALCESFLERSEGRDDLSDNLRGLIEVVKSIYHLSLTTLNSGQWEKEAWVYYVGMLLWGEQYNEVKGKCIGELGRLESDTAQHLGNKRFDLVRYIDKLMTPITHARRLVKTGNNPRFQMILNTKLVVQEVPCPDVRAAPIILSEQDVRSFLLGCHDDEAVSSVLEDDGTDSDDEGVANSLIEEKVMAVMKMSATDGVAAIPPHCECVLLNFLHDNRDSYKPYGYIAISKLCCLQCGLYLAAFRKYAKAKKIQGFYSRGCHNDVISRVLLPSSQDSEFEKFIESDIFTTVKKTIGNILRAEIARKRRYSQSTTASDSSPGSCPSVSPEEAQFLARFGKIPASTN